MPHSVRGESPASPARHNFSQVEESYDYPRSLNLEPGSEQHQDLLSMIYNRADMSHRSMQDRHDDWREVDRSLKGHVPPDFKRDSEEDSEIGEMPKVVLPFSYANLETLLTYMTTAFLEGTIFQYDEVGPEDAHKAFMLEQIIAQQSKKKEFGLKLHTMWRDAFSYNMGVIAPKWTREYGASTEVEEFGILDAINQTFNVRERRRTSRRQMMYEGHELENIDPYRYLPDPNVPVHEVQKSEFVGWISRTNEMELLRRERDREEFFNGRYVRKAMDDARSALIMNDASEGQRRRNVRDQPDNAYNNPVDEIWMYVDLIPSEWNLGSSQEPEKWQFGVAGDSVIIAARPLNLDHNKFPVVVASPDYDGHSIAPPSRMEIVQDMQQIIDFLYSSHLMNIRKAINDMFIVDPKLVNIHDVKDPKPGKLIRMRRMAWGQGRIDEGIQQLDVADVTKGHIEEGSYLLNVMEQSTGATDMAKGVVQNEGPRISAAASQGARQSVLSRMEKAARIIGYQAHQPLGKLLAYQTQQLMSRETWVKIQGEQNQQSGKGFSQEVQGGKVKVEPEDIVIPFDITATDPSVPGSEDVETWTNLYQVVAQNPQLAKQFDMVKMFKHIARQMGAKNIDNFVQRTQRPEVRPDEEVARERERGNLQPMDTQQNGSGT